MSSLPAAPFDPRRYVGSICQVTPATVVANLPLAARPNGTHYAGFPLPAGQVGEFVLIEAEDFAVLGRIIHVRLPERERLVVEPTSPVDGDVNSVGDIQLLTSISLSTGRCVRGIPSHPRVGQRVFSAHPLLVKHAVESDAVKDISRVQLATLPEAQNTTVALPPELLFGRHCAVLGATGGGKSWTVARMIEEIRRLGGKVILFDATGEYHRQRDGARHVYLGGRKEGDEDTREFVSYPYWQLTEGDLFVLFRPSSGSQAPKLREALRSLKLAKLEPHLAADGLMRKATRPKAPIEAALLTHAAALATPGVEFDISRLPAQIWEECVWPTGNPGSWGQAHVNDQSYCTTLMARIESDVSAPHLACVYQPEGLTPLPDVIEEFLDDRETRILRVSMESLPFEHHTRELVTNAIGRHLLRLAREDRFKQMPLVVVLDEAHQFLNRTIGDEFSRVALEAFGLVAKEGRKYCLTCVLATQRPRDVPEDVLSQIGMFVVHRLINDRDRQIVEKACGTLDSSAAAFLPTLAQGEALLVGVDAALPLPVRIHPPQFEPESSGPRYAELWT